ncbi:MAG: TRL-like family protein [Akkermansia sp.]|nr:TRL-like family protein [Akkermansia sp.]
MKNAFASIVLTASAFILSSCGAPVIGAIYTNTSLPVAVTSAAGSSKVGTATSTTYLGLWSEGDASIEAAKKNGGITTVSSVDAKVDSILGLYTTYTTTVRGN